MLKKKKKIFFSLSNLLDFSVCNNIVLNIKYLIHLKKNNNYIMFIIMIIMFLLL